MFRTLTLSPLSQGVRVEHKLEFLWLAIVAMWAAQGAAY